MIELLDGRTFPTQSQLLNVPIVMTTTAQALIWDAFPDRTLERGLPARLSEMMLAQAQDSYNNTPVFDRPPLRDFVFFAKVTGGVIDNEEDARRLLMYFSVDAHMQVVLMISLGMDPEVLRKKLKNPEFVVGIEGVSRDIVASKPLMYN